MRKDNPIARAIPHVVLTRFFLILRWLFRDHILFHKQKTCLRFLVESGPVGGAGHKDQECSSTFLYAGWCASKQYLPPDDNLTSHYHGMLQAYSNALFQSSCCPNVPGLAHQSGVAHHAHPFWHPVVNFDSTSKPSRHYLERYLLFDFPIIRGPSEWLLRISLFL